MLSVQVYNKFKFEPFKDHWIIVDSLGVLQFEEIKYNENTLVYLTLDDLYTIASKNKKPLVYLNQRSDTGVLIALLIALSNIWKVQLKVFTTQQKYWIDLIQSYQFNQKLLN